jgi:hypothetical protein
MHTRTAHPKTHTQTQQAHKHKYTHTWANTHIWVATSRRGALYIALVLVSTASFCLYCSRRHEQASQVTNTLVSDAESLHVHFVCVCVCVCVSMCLCTCMLVCVFVHVHLVIFERRVVSININLFLHGLFRGLPRFSYVVWPYQVECLCNQKQTNLTWILYLGAKETRGTLT